MGIKIAIIDDHTVLRNGLAELIKKLGYTVLFEASNGKELIEKLDKNNLPDLVLMDINMPDMDGYDSTQWLNAKYPQIKVLTLSMYDEESAIIRMIRSGARGYLLKECETGELKQAIESVITKGYHYTEMITGSLINSLHKDEDAGKTASMTGREIEFLKLATTELTYKEIAKKMNLSFRTVDGYREALFEKLGVKSRVGLVLFGIKNRIILID